MPLETDKSVQTPVRDSGQFARTELLLGRHALEILAQSRVAVFGLGGVGSYAVEALARSGIGSLDLIDHDKFSLSNLNRQLYATHRTVGRFKADVAAERIAEIHDACRILFQSGLNYLNGCDEVEKQIPQSPERDALIEFIRTSKRGIIKPYESKSKEE